MEASLPFDRDGEYGDFPGPHCLPEDGMEQFSSWLANDSKLQQCVHLQQEAKIIRWKSSLSPLTDIQKNQRSCCVMTASGERFEADAVVVTLPVGAGLSILALAIVLKKMQEKDRKTRGHCGGGPQSRGPKNKPAK